MPTTLPPEAQAELLEQCLNLTDSAGYYWKNVRYEPHTTEDNHFQLVHQTSKYRTARLLNFTLKHPDNIRAIHAAWPTSKTRRPPITESLRMSTICSVIKRVCPEIHKQVQDVVAKNTAERDHAYNTSRTRNCQTAINEKLGQIAQHLDDLTEALAKINKHREAEPAIAAARVAATQCKHHIQEVAV